ncbi:unnamed protein product [Coccothraustes coccothraustes]
MGVRMRWWSLLVSRQSCWCEATVAACIHRRCRGRSHFPFSGGSGERGAGVRSRVRRGEGTRVGKAIICRLLGRPGQRTRLAAERPVGSGRSSFGDAPSPWPGGRRTGPAPPPPPRNRLAGARSPGLRRPPGNGGPSPHARRTSPAPPRAPARETVPPAPALRRAAPLRAGAAERGRRARPAFCVRPAAGQGLGQRCSASPGRVGAAGQGTALTAAPLAPGLP